MDLRNVSTSLLMAAPPITISPKFPPKDYFVKAFSELHFLAARIWLESDESDFLSVSEVVNLLNTMRVGAGYLTFKRNISPEFAQKIKELY